ncbi:unnamed protein product [Nippostrongylus brasiliensis]|uniref:J domain-containing protein n=1 Tax=Nippostrongylus brasiliensis TaxID=27835 RepID=A0A0N4YF06_NIPBR|nr:unnamed protein product [Nippostrongylus brasiliensis]
MDNIRSKLPKKDFDERFLIREVRRKNTSDPRLICDSIALLIIRKQNYYDILGVKRNATQEEIRSAFVRKSNELHPDRSKKPKDNRIGWRRSSDTELFMEVKEAYDCLRKPAKRAAYDDQLSTSAGYLREATSIKFSGDTIVGLHSDRNDAYTGPRRRNAPASAHFRDPEKEYYMEKHQNRMFGVLAAHLRRKRHRQLMVSSHSPQEVNVSSEK